VHCEEDKTREKGLVHVLVGDAAFGVPYFRSLNNGLVCGSELALKIASFFDPEFPIEDVSTFHQFSTHDSPIDTSMNISSNVLSSLFSVGNSSTQMIKSKQYQYYDEADKDLPAPLKTYSNFTHQLAKTEIMLAQNKQMGLSVAKFGVSISGVVPWQVNFWKKKELEEFHVIFPFK